MLRVLKSRMLEKGVTNADVAGLIGRSERSVRAKIAEETDFSHPETIVIRDKFFPGMDIEFLFSSDRLQDGQAS